MDDRAVEVHQTFYNHSSLTFFTVQFILRFNPRL